MALIGRCGVALVLSGLSGCVVAPLPQRPLPLVAVPGPTKTSAEFQRDDVTCRAAAASLLPAVPSGQPGASAPALPEQSQEGATAAAGAYLHCMESHNNIVQPFAPARPLVYAGLVGYGYAPSYGPYDGYSTYPWLYDGYFGVGYGWRGGYGGGYRGGWGGHR